jgi:uncharacterized protein YpiB (UPF0302 family)
MHLYLREKTKKISNLCKKKNLELLIYIKERKRKKKKWVINYSRAHTHLLNLTHLLSGSKYKQK